MDEKDWLILQTLYEEKNITKTAERLYISQPALTYRIQQIEKEYATTLIVRGKKGIEFTPQGEYLVNYAKEMLLKAQKTKEAIKNMERKVQGMLRLGTSSNFAHYRLPKLLKNFLTEYPDVEINLKTGWSSDVIQLVYKDEVHVGIIRGDYQWPEQKHLLAEEPLFIASKEKFAIAELPRLPRINYMTDAHLKQTIDTWWKNRFTVPPRIMMEVDKIETCKELVLHGLGYSIFPSLCLRPDDELYTVLLTDEELIKRNTWIIYRNATLDLLVVRTFVDFVRRFYREEIHHESPLFKPGY